MATLNSPEGSRVLLLIHDLRMGGAERAFVAYANHLHGVPSAVLVRPNLDWLPQIRAGVPVYDLSAPHRTRFVPLSPSAGSKPEPPVVVHRREAPAAISLARKARRLAALAEHTGVEVVSTFLMKSHVIALCAKRWFAPHLRVVLNLHEVLSDHLEHHYAPATRALLRWFIPRHFRRADRIVAVADAVRSDLVRNFGLPDDRIVVVHNPLDLEAIRAAADEPLTTTLPPGRDPLVAAVGRLVPLKGFTLLLDAFALLVRRVPARLVIVGEGEQRLALEHRIEALRLGDRVALLGARSNPWNVMARADLVAVSSETEAFPYVIGEALALARPVVATGCSDGIVEYLEDGRCGLLVPPGDPVALAAGLERVLADAELRLSMGARGPERVAEFALPPTVARYEQVLSDVMVPQARGR